MRMGTDAEHEPPASAASPHGRNYAAETLSELNLALSFRPQKGPAGAYPPMPQLPECPLCSCADLQLVPAGAVAADPGLPRSAVWARVMMQDLAVLVGGVIKVESSTERSPVEGQ